MKKLSVFIILAVLFSPISSLAQSCPSTFSQVALSVGTSTYGTAIIKSFNYVAAENTYILGGDSTGPFFIQSVPTGAVSQGHEDIFLTFINPAQTFTVTIGGSGADYLSSVKVAPNNDIYVLGTFTGSQVNLCPYYSGVPLCTSVAVGTSTALPTSSFLMKFQYVGGALGGWTLAWTKTFNETNGQISSLYLTFDLNNEPIIGGTFSGTVGLDATHTIVNTSTPGYWYVTDGFVAKLDANGNVGWTYTWGAPFHWASFGGMAVDNFNTVHFTGSTGTSSSGSTSTIVLGSIDGFSGTVLSAATLGNPQGNNVGKDLILDQDGQHFYVLLQTYSTLDVDPGPGVSNVTPFSSNADSSVVVKYDLQGNVVWSKLFGATAFVPYQFQVVGPRKMTQDTCGNISVAGWWSNSTVQFDPNNTATISTATASYNATDWFVNVLDQNGNWMETHLIRSIPSGPYTLVENLTSYVGGGILLLGSFGQPLYVNTLTSAGLMYAPPGISSGLVLQGSSGFALYFN